MMFVTVIFADDYPQFGFFKADTKEALEKLVEYLEADSGEEKVYDIRDLDEEVQEA